MEHICNTVTLRGSLQALPQLSHENHGKRFYRFCLEVPRLSGAVDILPVIAEETILNTIDPTAGEMITVVGQIRSHNNREAGIRRLLIFVYAGALIAEDGPPINDVTLCGPLCKEPVYRRWKFPGHFTGRIICHVSYGAVLPERWPIAMCGIKSPSAADCKAAFTPSSQTRGPSSAPHMKSQPLPPRSRPTQNKNTTPFPFAHICVKMTKTQKGAAPWRRK